jgi:hypothetical protein
MISGRASGTLMLTVICFDRAFDPSTATVSRRLCTIATGAGVAA